jgi:hypothetical protein
MEAIEYDHPLAVWQGYNANPDYARMEGTEDWITVAEMLEGSYEWTEFRVFWSPSARRYFWYGDSGCSCNGWNDDLEGVQSFENGDRDDAVRGWERFAKVHKYTFGPQDIVEGTAEIRNFSEVK